MAVFGWHQAGGERRLGGWPTIGCRNDWDGCPMCGVVVFKSRLPVAGMEVVGDHESRKLGMTGWFSAGNIFQGKTIRGLVPCAK
jgi:hypothetical protein